MVLLLLFVLISLLLHSYVKNSRLRLLFGLISSSFIIAQGFSLFFTQGFIGYQYYVHFTLRGIFDVGALFWIEVIIATVSFVLLNVIFFYSYSFNKFLEKKNNNERGQQFLQYSKIVLLLLASSIILFQGNFLRDSKTLAQLFLPKGAQKFDEVLEENNMADYVRPSSIVAKKGKNILIISMESLERGLLSKKYEHLTPNLNRLKKKWNAIDIYQNEGSSWTSGSLYTMMTGFPAFFGLDPNESFNDSYYSNISSLGHVFKLCGYQSSFIIGMADFSGTLDMVNSFKIDEVYDIRNTKRTGYESWFGLRDKDLFDIAKRELKKVHDESFAMIISTSDTHFPDGFYDDRMEGKVAKRENKLEFMISALDYQVGSLVTFLEENNLLKSTTVYILPDHLKMGDPSMFEGTGERKLFVITNGEIDERTDKLYQIDLPKIILEGAKIEHNLIFLTDYINGDAQKFINNHINEITEINTHGLRNKNIPIHTK